MLGKTSEVRRSSNRQSCDRDYNSYKERVTQHNIRKSSTLLMASPPVMVGLERGAKTSLSQALVADGVRPGLRRKIKSNLTRRWGGGHDGDVGRAARVGEDFRGIRSSSWR